MLLKYYWDGVLPYCKIHLNKQHQVIIIDTYSYLFEKKLNLNLFFCKNGLTFGSLVK